MSLKNESDMNLVALWLRWDPLRWVAGAMAGLFAGSVLLLFSMGLSFLSGKEIWFPIKLGALPFLGSQATELGVHSQTLFIGLFFHETLSVVLGIVFAHFTATNSIRALTAMGLVWGIFTWIFIYNLFTPAFKSVFAANIPAAATFPVAIVFGLSLISVAFFDRVLREDSIKKT